ncbi:hypothetical protein BGX23_005913 [Mortierella sp. AD031]|nr:hypothetical protein BGX23_005913 [Mortierella sp. AD031]
MNLGQEHTRESAYLIPFPPKAATKHATDKSLCAISTASLPIPLPTFPSPTPRERKLSTNNNGINGSSSSVPYYDTNPFPLQSSVIISELSDASVTPNDFYIDMIGLDTSKGPSNSNLPRVTGASHKLSRDARQMVQQFPPPPPPPQVPPPAIPDEAALCQALYAARSPRSRAATTAFEGKEPLSQYWSPTPTGSRPSSIVSTGKSGAPFKGKKSSSRSTSLTRKAIDPLQGPSSPEPYPLPPSLYSYPPQDGGARDKKSLRSHRRSQSNIYGGGSTSSLDEQDRFQGSISPVQLCPPSRPILRHNHSYTGQSSDTNQDVEEIISGALAITAAKKQTEGSPTLSVPSSQDKRSYI